MEKIEAGFELKFNPGETLLNSSRTNEYIDVLEDFTNREIIQMAKLSRKEEKLTFDKLYLLFKYGEKDNPWEKLAYEDVKNIKKKLSERVVGLTARRRRNRRSLATRALLERNLP